MRTECVTTLKCPARVVAGSKFTQETMAMGLAKIGFGIWFDSPLSTDQERHQKDREEVECRKEKT